MLGEQFWEATQYIQANPKNADLVSVMKHLNSKNIGIEAVNAAAKLTLNLPDLVDSNGKVGVATMQCVADVAEMGLDVFKAMGKGAITGPLGFAFFSANAVSLVAQGYATTVSCSNAVIEGMHAVSRMSKEAIKMLASVSSRISLSVNKQHVCTIFTFANAVFGNAASCLRAS